MEKNRVASPLELVIPGFAVAGIHFLVPMDLPDGGFLQIVVGENPIAQAIPSSQVPKGGMVAIIAPENAEQLRPMLAQAIEAARLDNGGGRNGSNRAL